MPVRDNRAVTANREPLNVTNCNFTGQNLKSFRYKPLSTGTCRLVRGVEVENIGPRPVLAVKFIDTFFYLCSQSSNPFIVIKSQQEATRKDVYSK
jgi:hypothetical protein